MQCQKAQGQAESEKHCEAEWEGRTVEKNTKKSSGDRGISITLICYCGIKTEKG